MAPEKLIIIFGGTINGSTIGGGRASNAPNTQVQYLVGRVLLAQSMVVMQIKSAYENKVLFPKGPAIFAIFGIVIVRKLNQILLM